MVEYSIMWKQVSRCEYKAPWKCWSKLPDVAEAFAESLKDEARSMQFISPGIDIPITVDQISQRKQR